MRKYVIEGISGMEMSALNKGFERKTEQRKLKKVSSNPSTCGIFTTVPTVGGLSKACLFIVGSTGRGRVCVCTRTCALGERAVHHSLFYCQQKTKLFYSTSENMLDFSF